MPLIWGGVGLVVVIVVVAIVLATGGGHSSPKTDGGSSPAASDQGSPTASGTSTSGTSGTAPRTTTGGTTNVEDQVDPREELRIDFKRRQSMAESVHDLERLAVWCKKNGLDEEMQATIKTLFAKDTDNARAHGLLGHRQFAGAHPDYQDKWLSADEYAKAAKAEKEYQKRRAEDPRFDAIESAISTVKYQYLRDVPHFVVREWPYVLFVEDFGSQAKNDYYAAEKADQVRCFWNHMKKTFPGLVKNEPDIPFRVIVFKDEPSYNRFNAGEHGGKGSGSEKSRARAHFSLRTKYVYYYEKNAKGSSFDPETTLGVLFHECTHQIMNWLRPDTDPISPSMWFEEAFAEFIGAVKKTGKTEKDDKGQDRMIFEVSRVNKYRLAPIQQLIKMKRIFSLPTMFMCRSYAEANNTFQIMFGQTGGGWGQSLLYCQGWSFVYFCMNEPSGKYRDKMIDYIRKDAAGESYGYETLCECFGIANDEQWKPIEREWLSYVTRLKPDGTLKKR